RARQVRRLPEPAKRDATRHRFEKFLATRHRVLEQSGVGWSRANDVDVDVICREFAREGFGETDDGGLASRIYGFATGADTGRVGGDRDDFACATGLHPRRHGFAAIEHAAKVN